MRIFFAGTPEFAVLPLQALANHFTICGVLTNPDRPVGRSRRPLPPPVKIKALEMDLPVIQPEKLDQDLRETVRALNPDILVVAAYSKIFRENFLTLFPNGGINIHPSLLPKYRGPSPVQAAILNGDAEAGVTVQRLALKMDTGDILAQERISMKGNETAPELLDLSFRIGSRLLVDVIWRMQKGSLQPIPQNEEQASYCRLIQKEDGLIDWNEDADRIARMIRAYLPWPRAYTLYGNLDLFLLEGDVLPNGRSMGVDSGGGSEPGRVVGMDKEYGILIHTGRGILFVKRLQLETKKMMDWRSFLNGVRNFIGSRLGG
jgi:methionyl-tRNA formyltransferase